MGTVGTGAALILSRNADLIARRTGRRVRLCRALVRDLAKPRRIAFPDGVLTTEFSDIVDDSSIRVVVEVMGGVGPALDYVTRSIRAGKHVVTANKELMARHGAEIMSLATEHHVSIKFEGSVAGGIPIIGPLRYSLSANRIIELLGIVNGTTNYILTRMTNEKKRFEEVLEEAQRLGYAEPDPTNDVEGLDAAYKLAILASLAFGAYVAPGEVYTEGISRISPVDIDFARELGYVIKLLAIARSEGAQAGAASHNPGGAGGGLVQVRVHPAFVPASHPLASVNDVFNAIFVRGDASGDLMFYGRGAGDMPTGSSVVGDLMDVVRNLDRRSNHVGAPSGRARVMNIEDVVSRFYIHLRVLDRPGVMARIAGAFGDNQVSLASVIQKGRGTEVVSVVFITHEVQEKLVRRSLDTIRDMPVTDEIANVIRVAGEEA